MSASKSQVTMARTLVRHPSVQFLATSLLLSLPGLAWAEGNLPTFERDVRQILTAHCLKCHGLEARTIVIWTGEFGRLPVSQNGSGRDHNRNGFTLLLAGGGFKAGYIHGATDEVGYRSVEKPVGVNDLFATILHQLGLDHNKLIYRHHGRDETLTDAVVTRAKVVRELLA